MAVQTRTDRRFRRAHVRPSRRRRASAARRKLAGGVAALCGIAVAAFFLPGVLSSAGFLRVTTIAVRGQEHVSQGEILALIGPLRGQNILKADLETHRQHLMASGWVKTATLRRVLPSTIEISVEERVPVGLARLGGRLYLIDSGGTLIDEYGPRFADPGLPIIDGLARAPRRSSTKRGHVWHRASWRRSMHRLSCQTESPRSTLGIRTMPLFFSTTARHSSIWATNCSWNDFKSISSWRRRCVHTCQTSTTSI